MTRKILQTPRYWLILEDCGKIFKDFKAVVEFNEPIPPFETRFDSKLESILGSVKQSFGGGYLNPTVLDAAAAYLNQLIRGHPFRNGNKRMAVLFTHVFLVLNGVDFTLTSQELFVFAVIVARAGELGRDSDETKNLCREVIQKYSKHYVG